MCKESDHRQWNRRDFLKTSGLVTGMSLLFSPLLSARPARFTKTSQVLQTTDRIIVIIRLKGGNDGLNTFVPLYDYSRYKALRKNIGLRKDEMVRLGKDFGMHQGLSPLQGLWDKGMMKVINGVGYNNPDLSHFRSKEIWETGVESHLRSSTGWAGRFFDGGGGKTSEVLGNLRGLEHPLIIRLDNEADLSFRGKDGEQSVSLTDVEDLYRIAQSGRKDKFPLADNTPYGNELAFLQSVSGKAMRFSETIHKAYKKVHTSSAYGNGEFAERMKTLSRLIRGGLGTRLYSVAFGDFDTHAQQPWKHGELLGQLGKGIRAFYDDLAKAGMADKVITVTLSEFGRRAEQNGSNGTDHGTAAPVMVFGGALSGNGFLGEAPDLNALDQDGNLKHGVDFKSVYASLLWGGFGAGDDVLGASVGEGFGVLEGLFG